MASIKINARDKDGRGAGNNLSLRDLKPGDFFDFKYAGDANYGELMVLDEVSDTDGMKAWAIRTLLCPHKSQVRVGVPSSLLNLSARVYSAIGVSAYDPLYKTYDAEIFRDQEKKEAAAVPRNEKGYKS